uniref:Uncharacterized protein n=1 Tax=Oryza glumipatula TaxID=40148 RepID=A0A0E0BJD3_9ORYZ
MERRMAGMEVVRWRGGGQRASRLRGGLGKTSPPVQCTVAAAAEGDDLVSSGGLRRRRPMGKTSSLAGGWGRRRLWPQRMGKLRWWLGKTWPLIQCAEAAAVECAVAAEGDDDARSELRIERVMRRNLRLAFAPGEGEIVRWRRLDGIDYI